MRKIEFRGIDADDPEKKRWFYGSYFEHLPYTPAVFGYVPIPESDYKHLMVIEGFSDWNMPRGIQVADVLPETVGEYTGICDKYGIKIFEGDIVHVWDNGTAVVKFDGSLDRGQWMCEFVPSYPDFKPWTAPLFGWIEGNVDGSVFKVVGNRFQNPELLEENHGK